jgi:flagellar protein FliO/FliZ
VPMPAAPTPAPAARRPVRASDTLAGLANELSRPNGHNDPVISTTRPVPPPDISAIRPGAPHPAPAASADTGGDQNLADMAQRLEAALRRPGAPATPAATATRPITANPPAPPAGNPVPNPALASAPRIDSVNGARDKAAKPEPAAAPDQGGAAFGSLEQEMANLLGRPSGKA